MHVTLNTHDHRARYPFGFRLAGGSRFGVTSPTYYPGFNQSVKLPPLPVQCRLRTQDSLAEKGDPRHNANSIYEGVITMGMGSSFKREMLEKQTTVFQVGDSGDAAYVIESGCVEVLVGSANEQRRLALLAEGAMFGEVALLDRQPRTATVRTLVPTTLIRIDRAHVEELLMRSDPVIQYLLQLLLKRFRNANGNSLVPNEALLAAEPLPQSSPPTADPHDAAVRTLSLAHDLSNAIEASQLELFYQPIFLLKNTVLVGFEALIRWRHPSLGLVNPDEFIPLAEKRD